MRSPGRPEGCCTSDVECEARIGIADLETRRATARVRVHPRVRDPPGGRVDDATTQRPGPRREPIGAADTEVEDALHLRAVDGDAELPDEEPELWRDDPAVCPMTVVGVPQRDRPWIDAGDADRADRGRRGKEDLARQPDHPVRRGTVRSDRHEVPSAAVPRDDHHSAVPRPHGAGLRREVRARPEDLAGSIDQPRPIVRSA